MIPQVMMNREARKLLESLDSLASQYSISTLVTQKQVYIAEQITQKYYTAPILNAIKSKVKQLKKKSSKHFTIEHWISVLDCMFQSNASVKRDMSNVNIIDADIGYEGFCIISKYLITDYSIQDAGTIYNIVGKYTPDRIQSAINVAKSNNVYNIQYINAILEKEQALSNIKKQGINKMRERIDNSNSILDKKLVQHSIIDMATNQYNWEQEKENAELERKMQEVLNNMGR